MPLQPVEIERFVRDGFLRLEDAFPRALADEGRGILWRAMGLDPDRPETWTEPVVRLWHHAEAPFVAAANTPALHEAYDALVGVGRWAPLPGLGTWPIRFPADVSAGDDGWHVDVSFAGPGDDPNDFMAYRANVRSKGRALLLLFLFSDVGEEDAPTRIRVGSHRAMARQLAPAGEAGVRLGDMDFESINGDIVLATGAAGTVYLCHPFLVHAAQRHRGRTPRFMAQPPLYPKDAFSVEGPSPVERAIQLALNERG